jgi:hypothetical protein
MNHEGLNQLPGLVESLFGHHGWIPQYECDIAMHNYHVLGGNLEMANGVTSLASTYTQWLCKSESHGRH